MSEEFKFPQRWIYRVLRIEEPRYAEEALNGLAKDGWELLTVQPHGCALVHYLKRPMPIL